MFHRGFEETKFSLSVFFKGFYLKERRESFAIEIENPKKNMSCWSKNSYKQ